MIQPLVRRATQCIANSVADDPRFATALHIADTPPLRNRLLEAMSSSFRMRNRALRARRARAVVASRTLIIVAGG
jgi:hypothetical protein